MTDFARGFRRRWWLANSGGFAVGLVAFSLLGHGFTGPHGDELTVAQYIGHTAGLIGAAAIILAAQRRALQPLREVSGKRMTLGVLAFVLQVRSLRRAKEFLAQRNLLRKSKDNTVAIDPAAIGGLRITLEQINLASDVSND